MVGRTVSGLEVFGPRTLRRHPPGPADFIARVVGSRVVAACRRGKYLWLPLSPAPSALVATEATEAVVAPRGRRGQSPAVRAAEPAPPHLRARFTFADDAPESRFVDQRT